MGLRQYIVRNITDLKVVLGTQTPPSNACLGQILRQARMIDTRQLQTALQRQHREQGKHLGRILVEQRLVSQEQINFALAQKFGIPCVKLEGIEIMPEVLSKVPVDLATHFNILPLGEIDGRLIVATENPLDAKGMEALRFHTNLKIEPVMSSARDITLALSKYYSKFDEHEALEDIRLGVSSYNAAGESAHLIEQQAKRKPIVRLLNAIVLQAVIRNASDINIRPGRDKVDVHYRIDGRLQLSRTLHKSLLPSLVSRIKIIAQMDIAERRLPQDGHARLVRKNAVIDLRVSVLPTVHGESVVIRLLNKELGVKPLHRLGLSGGAQKRVRHMLNRNHGLFLITGPTGAGKTTTLYALINEVKQRNVHILSVEDPVEYDMEGIEQVQIAPARDYGFASALRHFLRHDPDVIMVGEIRDQETAGIANRAALTGHLVLSSLHTNDTASSITRLLDLGIEPYLLSSTLLGVVAQRLVRVICRRCREEHRADDNVYQLLEIDRRQVFYHGGGCPVCHYTGYQGRTMVYELLEVTPLIAEMISRCRPAREIREASLRQGMTPLTHNALALARNGVTSLQEVLSAGFA